MVLSFEQAGELMDKIADSFPQEFYQELNGAILLLPQEKRHPNAPDLYVMGTYCRNQLGRYIEIYYGSFAAMAETGRWSEQRWQDELWGTLSHEFTHHLESLAGERALEDKDDEFMARYWMQKQRKKERESR